MRTTEIRKFLWSLLLEEGCVDCGESNPVVLEFDHVRGKKKFKISANETYFSPFELLLLELEKCEIRCANCHRKVTAERGNFWAHRYSEGDFT